MSATMTATDVPPEATDVQASLDQAQLRLAGVMEGELAARTVEYNLSVASPAWGSPCTSL